jgi:mismatch-specific thymine-DNA glycosylase
MESGETLPDILNDNLWVLFVGYNPGRFSIQRGHHFAGPENDFWPLLFESGLTGRRLGYRDDRELLVWNLGVTNVVDRMTPSSQDLRREELVEGGYRLRQKVWQLRPRVVCCLGKDVYRAYADRRARDAVAWGPTPHPVVEGVLDVVAPNPSRRSTVPYATRLAVMHRVAALSRG